MTTDTLPSKVENIVGNDLSEFLQQEIFTIGEKAVTPFTIIVVVVALAVVVAAAKLIEHRIAWLLARNDPDRAGSADATARLVYYLILVTGLLLTLHNVGIQLSALFAAGAIFAVGLGFGLQNVVQNFVSGVILLGERVIKPGDIVEIDGRMVRIENMGLRSTVTRTLDEEQIIVPNEKLVSGQVKNFTLSDRLYRLRVDVGVAYASDLPRVFDVLQEAGDEEADIPGRTARVLLRGFGSSSIDFEVSIWIEDPWDAMARKSRLSLTIWRHLREAGIVIAFPQLDLHVDRELLDAMGRRELPDRSD